MNIGIVGYFNPSEIREYLPNNLKIPNINTMASSVNAIVKGLLDEGHNITVFTTYDYKGKYYKISGNRIEIHLVSRNPKIKGLRIFDRLYTVNRIKKMISLSIENIDILHAQWTYDFALAAKSFSKQVPVFCTVRDWCPYILSLQHGINYLYWLISLCIFRKVMKGNSIQFIANSYYTKDRILSEYPDKRIYIIPNPIKKENILLDRSQYPKENTFISISQTLNDVRKNFERLLIAFKIYRKDNKLSKLILVGDYSNQLKEKWKSIDLLEGVILTGKVQRSELYRLLDNSSVLIHPSEEETFGNTLLEGMARRLPCVGGKDSGAVPHVLGNGLYGILCNIYDVNSIAMAMKKTEDIEFTSKIIQRSTEYLIKTYSNNVVATTHVELYKSYIKDYNDRKNI